MGDTQYVGRRTLDPCPNGMALEPTYSDVSYTRFFEGDLGRTALTKKRMNLQNFSSAGCRWFRILHTCLHYYCRGKDIRLEAHIRVPSGSDILVPVGKCEARGTLPTSTFSHSRDPPLLLNPRVMLIRSEDRRFVVAGRAVSLVLGSRGGGLFSDVACWWRLSSPSPPVLGGRVMVREDRSAVERGPLRVYDVVLRAQVFVCESHDPEGGAEALV